MTLNADAGPAQAGATYTAWPLSELPEWMLADAPGQAAWLVVREPGDAIGWIQAPCACPAAGLHPGRAVRAAGSRRARPGVPAAGHGPGHLPQGRRTVAFPRPGADGGAFRRECLGRHLISRVAADQHAGDVVRRRRGRTEPVNVAATDLARQHGFIWRRLHGPVMLCRAGG